MNALNLRSCALVLAVACAMAPARSRAYSTPEAFAETPTAGGGGGRWFTGSPADGLGCAVCHSPGPGQREFPLYVAGLPVDGYELAMPREIVLSWPELSQRWRELRPDPTQPRVMGAPYASVGMIAELIAESGKASGTIELRGASATAAEQCEQTRPNLQPRLGTKLYQVRPGQPALLIKPDAAGTLRCDSKRLGQRCIIALSACGAQQTRIVWTPPSTQEGPIWFSAGFVATDAQNGVPEADSVREISVPLIQSGSAADRYEETLHGSCSIASVRAARGWACALGLLAVALVVTRLRARRALRAAAIAALACVALGACAEDAEVSPSSYPSAGLYTPGNILGASDPTDTPAPEVGLGDRCVSLPPVVDAGPGTVTVGELQLKYTTQTMEGQYAPRNVSAAWIETPDGAYVATLKIGAGLRRPALVYWHDHTCTEKPGPDVVTSATMRDHTKEHEAHWSGVDFEGKPVADGPYKLFIEVTETDKEPGESTSFDFMKSAQAYDMPLAVAFDGPLAGVNIRWAPE